MRVVIQKVSQASVAVDDAVVAQIDKGLLVLVGIAPDDTENDSAFIIRKIINIRIFDDENGKMNKCVKDVKGEILLVSQFTLYGDVRKGNRPSFTSAMHPERAKPFYEDFVDQFKQQYHAVQSGIFGAYMKVSLVNDGPITILLDSPTK